MIRSQSNHSFLNRSFPSFSLNIIYINMIKSKKNPIILCSINKIYTNIQHILPLILSVPILSPHSL